MMEFTDNQIQVREEDKSPIWIAVVAFFIILIIILGILLFAVYYVWKTVYNTEKGGKEDIENVAKCLGVGFEMLSYDKDLNTITIKRNEVGEEEVYLIVLVDGIAIVNGDELIGKGETKVINVDLTEKNMIEVSAKVGDVICGVKNSQEII